MNIPEQLTDWAIVYENVPGLRQKINMMIDKMKNNLGDLYHIRLQDPNLVELRNLYQFDWNISKYTMVVVVINSRTNKSEINKK